MKCISCEAPISPSFKHAIESNLCPACGGKIMNENMEELLEELRSALEAMPNDPVGLAGWLLSHYELRKVGTGEPVAEFYGTKQARVSSEADMQNLKIPNNRIQKFYKQAGVKSPQEYKALAEKLELTGADYGDYGEDTVEEDEVVEEDIDPNYKKAALAAMQSPKMSREQIRAMQRNIARSQENTLHKDDLPEALHEDRLDRLKKQQELSLGGSVGKIVRSE